MSVRSSGISGRVKLAYLAAVLIAVIALPEPWFLGALLAAQIVLWLFDRLGLAALWRTGKRLAVLFAVVLVSYAFVPVGAGSGDFWHPLDFGLFTLEVNLAGVALALTMCARIATLVVASAWVQRSGSPGELLRALESFHVPQLLAVSINATLELATGAGGGRGKGKGGGDGSSEGAGQRNRRGIGERLRVSFADIRRARLDFFTTMISDALKRAEGFVARTAPGLDKSVAHDVAVIVSVASVAMAMKAVQVLPGLPIAPGHKNILIVPLFLLAAARTETRFGGLWAGLTIGAVSVMMGFGKYGVLEIAHFAVPGLLADMLYPALAAMRARLARLAAFAFAGAILGLGRFAANFLVILLAGAPDIAFVLYLPMLLSQVTFGALSCFVAVAVLGTTASETSRLSFERQKARNTGKN